MEIKIDNLSSCTFLGKDLIKKISVESYRLCATYVIVNKAKYNKYAECELFEDGNCIDWHYSINI